MSPPREDVPARRTWSSRGLCSALVCVASVLTGGVGSAAAASLPEVSAQLAQADLATDQAVRVRSLGLNCDLGELTLTKGVLVPASTVGGRPAEFVFVGDGRLTVRPPDGIEEAQLELFAGETPLEEAFSRAVFVLANDAAVEALWNRQPRTALTAEEASSVASTWTAWRSSVERRQLAVDLAIVADALDDPAYAGYFLVWMPGTEKGDLVYLSDPDAFEQVTVGHFVPLESSEKEKRSLERALTRAQRRGRALGVSVDDLGAWDQWLSGARRRANGEAAHGYTDVEPSHYELAVTLQDERDLPLDGVARLTVKPATLGRTVAKFRLNSDLELTAVEDGEGRVLPYLRRGDTILVGLELPLQRDESRVFVLRYHGKLLEHEEKSWALADPLGWYPHAGDFDRATYDVRLQWPHRLRLVASGSRVEGGSVAGGLDWERRKLDVPAIGFSFEVGKFKVIEDTAGSVHITMAYDPQVRELSSEIEKEILATVKGALTYFGGVYGPYPLPQLTVVTVPRHYSQGLLGFVTLAAGQLWDYDFLAALLNIEDRRTIVAHEIAHQWWGNVVGFANYRDVWISEALASYSASLYGRNELDWKKRPRIGPTTGWPSRLLAEAADGRPVEALGPLVLGPRLASSKSASAYQDIVYLKGALVFDMLSRGFGEADFLRLLRALIEAAGGREISTEDFFSIIGKISGNDLTHFVEQFVYGTGLPEISYSYRFSAAGEGKWKLIGQARQESPIRYRYSLVSLADGRLDVRRVAERQLDDGQLATSTLYVPVQVKVRNPEAKPHRGREKPEDSMWVEGRVALAGRLSDLSLDLDHEPLRFFLDRDEEVFGRFFDETRELKRVQLGKAQAVAASGEVEAAEQEFRRVFDQPIVSLPEGEEDETWDSRRKALNTRLLEARAHLGLARLCMDAGRADCEDEITAAKKSAGGLVYFWVEDEVDVLESRAQVLRGETAKALKHLRREVLKREDLDRTEAWLLLAIAARQEHDAESLRQASEEAKKRGVDMTLLGAPAAGRR